MERAETAKIVYMLLSTLRLQRPIPDEDALLDGWHLALGDLPYGLVQLAAARLLQEATYFPEPSALREIVLVEQTHMPDADELWAHISRVVRGVAELSTLPPIGREAVNGLGGLGQLRNGNPSVDRAAFLKAWPAMKARHLRSLTPQEAAAPLAIAAEPEDPGMRLVDYANQAPRPIPLTIVPRTKNEGV